MNVETNRWFEGLNDRQREAVLAGDDPVLVVDVTGLRQWRIEQDPRHENDLLLLRSIAAKYDGIHTGPALEQFLEEALLAVEVDDYD